MRENKKRYGERHKAEKAAYDKEYRKKNKIKLSKQKAAWEKKSKAAQIRRNLRRRVSHALKGESKLAHTLELLGCSVEFLKNYLASMFTENMSWDNYGEWHIDHIRPCSFFDLSDPE